MLPRSFVTRALPVAAAAALLLGASACTDDDDPPESTPTTTRPSTSTTTEAELSDEEQIEALLTEWFDVVNEIVALDRPVSDASEFISGDYLTSFTDSVNQRITDGYDSRPSEQSELVIEHIEVDGDAASAQICIEDASADILAATGEVLDDSVSVDQFEDTLARDGAEWTITSRDVVSSLPATVGCPAQ